MSEFLPEDTTPHPGTAAAGITPPQDIAAPPSPPSYAQAAPPLPYAAAAPPLPYAQAAPPPFAQVAPPLPNTAWNMAPPEWAPPPAKKRKAWPWVVGIVGGLVVLGGAATVIILGVSGALNADQNDNYVGEPISSTDAPTLGDQLLVSDDGTVAFDIGSDWVDAATLTDVSSMSEGLPRGGSVVATYFTFDPYTAVDGPPTFVIVVEGAEASLVGPVQVESMHADFMEGATDAAKEECLVVTSDGPDAVTTSNGLDGLVSAFSCDLQGTPIRSLMYTFAHGRRVAFVQVVSYTTSFDDATAALVTDSLRIDK